jgi:hypothetical protein
MTETRIASNGRTYRAYTAAAIAAHSGPRRRTASQRVWGWPCPFCGTDGPVPHAVGTDGHLTGELRCAAPLCREVWDPDQV